MVNLQHSDRQPRHDGMASAVGGLGVRLKLAIDAWRQRAALARELTELANRGELDGTLADAGIYRSDIPELLNGHPDGAAQLSAMMRRLGVDPETLVDRRGIRDIEWRCIGCRTWRQCRAWLAEPAADDRSRPEFCPNIDALEALRAGQGNGRRDPDAATGGILAELVAMRGQGY